MARGLEKPLDCDSISGSAGRLFLLLEYNCSPWVTGAPSLRPCPYSIVANYPGFLWCVRVPLYTHSPSLSSALSLTPSVRV